MFNCAKLLRNFVVDKMCEICDNDIKNEGEEVIEGVGSSSEQFTTNQL